MKNVMSYKGYRARVEFDPDDGLFVGRLAGINDVVGFHADSVDALGAAFEEAVEDYVETCERIGKAPEKAASGRLMLRIDPEVHAAALTMSELTGKSLNAFAETVLREATRAARPPSDRSA